MEKIINILKRNDLYSENSYNKTIQDIYRNNTIDEILEQGEAYSKKKKLPPTRVCQKYGIVASLNILNSIEHSNKFEH